MKRWGICLLCLALLLAGCGQSREAERQAQFAEDLSTRRDLAFTARVRAEYADKTVAFRLRYSEQPEGCTLELLEPEELAGISLHLDEGGAQLRLEEIRLDTGPLDRYGLSPVSALPALTEALRQGHLESSRTEGELTVWELTADDELTVQVWLDEALTPLRAELISDGRVNVIVELEDGNFWQSWP